jgi:hypothetical protein
MTIPRWSTIGLFVCVGMQLILTWLQSRKTRTNYRKSVLPAALLAGAVSIIFVREFFDDNPRWFDIPVAILLSSILLWLLGLSAVRLTRYLKESWRLEDKANK